MGEGLRTGFELRISLIRFIGDSLIRNSIHTNLQDISSFLSIFCQVSSFIVGHDISQYGTLIDRENTPIISVTFFSLCLCFSCIFTSLLLHFRISLYTQIMETVNMDIVSRLDKILQTATTITAAKSKDVKDKTIDQQFDSGPTNNLGGYLKNEREKALLSMLRMIEDKVNNTEELLSNQTSSIFRHMMKLLGIAILS